MKEKFLPLGSVVLLKNATKRLMITGFYVKADKNNEKTYDYVGCLYPEGVVNSNQTCLFDHNQIEKIYHLGLIDYEEKEFKKELVEEVNKILNS